LVDLTKHYNYMKNELDKCLRTHMESLAFILKHTFLFSKVNSVKLLSNSLLEEVIPL
jgi:hypothetical protein